MKRPSGKMTHGEHFNGRSLPEVEEVRAQAALERERGWQWRVTLVGEDEPRDVKGEHRILCVLKEWI